MNRRTFLKSAAALLTSPLWIRISRLFVLPPINTEILECAIQARELVLENELTGWTTTLSAGEILRFNVDSQMAVDHAHLLFEVYKEPLYEHN